MRRSARNERATAKAMRITHDIARATAVGPMPRAQRWLCAALLVITAPVWMLGLLVLGLAMAGWNLVTVFTGRTE